VKFLPQGDKMRYWNKEQVRQVLNHYNADHDLGADCPVTWREERLAQAIMDMDEEIEALKAQVKALLAAVPSAKVE